MGRSILGQSYFNNKPFDGYFLLLCFTVSCGIADVVAAVLATCLVTCKPDAWDFPSSQKLDPSGVFKATSPQQISHPTTVIIKSPGGRNSRANIYLVLNHQRVPNRSFTRLTQTSWLPWTWKHSWTPPRRIPLNRRLRALWRIERETSPNGGIGNVIVAVIETEVDIATAIMGDAEIVGTAPTEAAGVHPM